MTFQRTILLATIPVLVLTGGTFALAQSNQRAQSIAQTPLSEGDQMRPGRGDRMMRWTEELDLSPDQSAQIQVIQTEARTAAEGLHQQLQQAHETLRSLMASDASVEQLRQQHQQLQTLKQQMGNQHFETMLAIREVLTPEQRAELAELMQQHRGHHMGPGPR